MTKNTSKLAAVSLICFGLLTLLMLFSGDHKAAAFSDRQLQAINNATVNALRVKVRETYTKKQVVFGQVQAVQQTMIGFDRSGIVARLTAENGSAVTRGQALAFLDDARISAQKKELRADLTRAKAEAKLAGLSQQRVQNLVKNKLESEQRLDEERARVDAAIAQVEAVEAKLQTLDVESAKSILSAPFSGQVVSQFVDIGAPVNAGQSVFELIDDGPLEVHFGLPEDIAFSFEVQQEVKIEINGEKLLGKMQSISTNRALNTRTVNGIFSIDIPEGRLSNIVSGDLASISLYTPVNKQGIWLPISSLANGIRGLWTVFVVDETNNTLKPRLVSVEYSNDDMVYVRGALKDNELVVVDGTHRLTPEQSVSNVNEYTKIADVPKVSAKASL